MFGFSLSEFKITFETWRVHQEEYIAINPKEWEVIRDDGQSIILRRRKA